MNPHFTEDAEADLLEAVAYVAADDPAAAHRFLERFREIATSLAAGLVEGPETTLTDRRVVRSWPLHPYRIYYRRVQGGIEIIRIYHQARRPIES